MKSLLIFILITLLYGCIPQDPALTLEIPKGGFKVVQHTRNEAKRLKNVLYLKPRRIAENEFNTLELSTYIDSMYSVMQRKAGVGIASNQIGKRLQIFIIEAESDNPRYKVLGAVPKQIFINPIITAVSEKRKNFWHGCLSANGENRGNVATYEWIDYECRNQKGGIISGRLEGFGAVIFQHEFRHMLGGTYLDHANDFLAKDELDPKLDSGELPFFDYADDSLPLLIEGYTLGESIEEYHSH